MALPAKTKSLTDMQQKFLDLLFGEAMGDPHRAKVLAGYSEDTNTSWLIKSVQEELIDYTKLYMASNGPRAALELMVLLTNPNEAGATTKLKVIQEIFNRGGIIDRTPAQGLELNVPAGGIVILPAKDINQKQIDLERTEFSRINDTYKEIDYEES